MNVNDVNAKYFIGTYNGEEFPLAIGICNPLDIFGQGGFQQADCLSEDTVEWKQYNDANCSTLVLTKTFNSSYQTGDGRLNDFNCNGTNSYAAIEYAAFFCDRSTTYIINTAIGVCTFVDDDEVRFQTYCEENWMQTYYFDSLNQTGTDCDEDNLYKAVNATDTCGFVMTISGVDFYGTVCWHLFCIFWSLLIINDSYFLALCFFILYFVGDRLCG